MFIYLFRLDYTTNIHKSHVFMLNAVYIYMLYPTYNMSHMIYHTYWRILSLDPQKSGPSPLPQVAMSGHDSASQHGGTSWDGEHMASARRNIWARVFLGRYKI